MTREAITRGIHHLGLSVPDPDESAAFFTSLLGWREVRRVEDYPAVFVSDGSILLTLWKTREEPPIAFDKDRNVGLHHLALAVDSEAALLGVHDTLVRHGIEIEFAPEPLRDGPARHMMCRAPGDIRMEFIWPGS